MNDKLSADNSSKNSRYVNQIELIIRIGLGVFLLGAAVSEISHATVVMISIEKLGYPDYLARLLGVAKIVGVLVLWIPYLKRWREWAYAGFTFNLLGACISFILAQQWIIPDVIIAPIVLVVIVVSYTLYRKRFPYSQDFQE